MNIVKAYGMSNEDILTSALIAIGGPTPVQIVNVGEGLWRLTGLGLIAGIMKPYTNREVLEMIGSASTVLLKKELGSDNAFLVKGTVPNITLEAPK